MFSKIEEKEKNIDAFARDDLLSKFIAKIQDFNYVNFSNKTHTYNLN